MKYVAIAFSLMSLPAFAQFNDTTHYYLSAATSGIVNKTNDGSAFVLTNNGSFKINRKTFVFNSAVNWIYGEQQQQLTNNDLTTAVDFNWYRYGNRKLYYWGLANYDKSFSLNIKNRAQSGLGIAWSIIDKEDAYLNLSDGILYEYSDLVLEDDTGDIYSTVRNSFRLQYRFNIRNTVVLDGSSFLQNSLQYGNDYIIRSYTGLSFKIRSWLSLTAAATYNEMKRTNRETLLLTFGAKAETYF